MEYKARIKDLPQNERPRERLAEHGPAYLSTPELLAILIRVGTPKKSALELSRELLSKFKNLRALSRASIEDICELKGIGPAKAVQIKAAFELAKRLSAVTGADRHIVTDPADVANFLMDDMGHLEREELRLVILGSRNQILAIPTITTGTLNGNLTHPRETFRQAIQKNAASVIMVHNHPSGDPTPSQEDIVLTARYVEAGKILGIDVLDHVIIGCGKFISLREEGYINEQCAMGSEQ